MPVLEGKWKAVIYRILDDSEKHSNATSIGTDTTADQDLLESILWTMDYQCAWNCAHVVCSQGLVSLESCRYLPCITHSCTSRTVWTSARCPEFWCRWLFLASCFIYWTVTWWLIILPECLKSSKWQNYSKNKIHMEQKSNSNQNKCLFIRKKQSTKPTQANLLTPYIGVLSAVLFLIKWSNKTY